MAADSGGGTSGKARVLAGDISRPPIGAALVERAERQFGGLDKFDSGTRALFVREDSGIG